MENKKGIRRNKKELRRINKEGRLKMWSQVPLRDTAVILKTSNNDMKRQKCITTIKRVRWTSLRSRKLHWDAA